MNNKMSAKSPNGHLGGSASGGKTALISVFNKEGIVEFTKELQSLDYKILASGGTAKVLIDAGIDVTDVAGLVGGGAILGHRVVTLSREIHAGLLARDNAEDRAELEKLNIPFIDLVCVDLYPLEQEISKQQTANSREEALAAVLEKTDIGGPTMIRSGAKARKIVICDPTDRVKVLEWMKAGEKDREQFVGDLCAKAEYVCASYILASARYQSKGKYDGFIGKQTMEAKYGENGWQTPAALFSSSEVDDEFSPKQFTLLAGTPPSYNNLADIDRLLQTITHIAAGFDLNNRGENLKIAVGVKHGNPCGAAVDIDESITVKKMLEGDLRAIFGGVVMVNFPINEELAEVLLTHKMESGRRLLDGIIAPSFTQGAIEMMKRRGDKCRFLANNYLNNLNKNSLDKHDRFRFVRGGFLKQPNYSYILDLLKEDKLGSVELQDILLAWAVGSTSNSNTVTITKNNQLLGNGVGQQDRVGCCELAIKRATTAGHSIEGAVAYSDSFFPFTDGPETLVNAGIKTIFATSGSVKDEEVKKLCQDRGVNLVMIPDKDARGFFGH